MLKQLEQAVASYLDLSWPALLASSFTTILVIHVLRIRYRHDLRKIPGPFLASFSNIDRIRSAIKGDQMTYHLDLHRKHGKLVRVGPNHVSISDGDTIPQIYGISTNFIKSDYYVPFDPITPKGTFPTMFSVRDDKVHKAIKRPVAHAYSMSTLRELEPMNDACSEIFLQKLEGMVGTSVDLGKWLHWYAFDVISSITFSNRLGFMEQETDVGGIIHAIEGRLVYCAIAGEAPWLHKYCFFGNPFMERLANLIPAVAALGSSNKIGAFSAKQLQRYRNKDPNATETQLPDMLDRFKRFKDGEQQMDDTRLLLHSSTNIFAGSDTTAISMRSIFYYLCRTPSAHKKLLAEIDQADQEGRLSDPVTFAEVQELKYVQAVVKEGLRMHPAVGQLLERLVPPGGAEVCGTWFAGGTIVGINPWVVARDKEVYGEDSDKFRPERWLDADEQQLKMMERNNLAVSSVAFSWKCDCFAGNKNMLTISSVVRSRS
jgi:cytochrome P450